MENINYKKKIVNITLFRVITLFFSLTFLILVPHICLPEDYSKFSLVYSFIQIISIILFSWPNQYLLKFGRENFLNKQQFVNQFTSRIFIHIFILTLCLIVITFFSDKVSGFFSIKENTFQLLLIFGILCLPLFDILVVVAQVCGKFLIYSIAPLILKLSQLTGLILIFIFSWNNSVTLIFSTLLGVLFSIILIIFEIPKKTFKFKFDFREIKKLLKYSSFVPISVSFLFFFHWLDVWFLKIKYGYEFSGIFAWAYSFILLGNGFFTSFSVILATKVIDDKRKKSNYAYITSLLNISYLISFFTPLLGVILYLTFQLLNLNFYEKAISILLIMLSTFSFQFIFVLIQPLIYAKNKLVPKLSMIVLIMLLIKFFILYIASELELMILIPLATILAYLIGVIFQLKTLKFNIFLKKEICFFKIIIFTFMTFTCLLAFLKGFILLFLICSLFQILISIIFFKLGYFNINLFKLIINKQTNSN